VQPQLLDTEVRRLPMQFSHFGHAISRLPISRGCSTYIGPIAVLKNQADNQSIRALVDGNYEYTEAHVPAAIVYNLILLEVFALM